MSFYDGRERRLEQENAELRAALDRELRRSSDLQRHAAACEEIARRAYRGWAYDGKRREQEQENQS